MIMSRGHLLHPAALLTCLLEPPQVITEDGICLDAVLQALQLKLKFRRRFFGKVINHPFLMPLGSHEALGPEISEVLGDGHLGQFQNRLEMADAERALGQQVKDAEPCFVTKAAINLQQFHMRHRTYTPYGICLSTGDSAH